MTLIDLPNTVKFGYVKGRYAEFGSDTDRDEDRLPDFEPSTGSVTFKPLTEMFIVSNPTRHVVIKSSTYPLGADGQISDGFDSDGVWVVVGSYRVTSNIKGMTIPLYTITVTEEHTMEDPLDLVLAPPIIPEPTVKLVVNQQLYEDTVAARDEARALVDGIEQGPNAVVVLDVGEVVPEGTPPGTLIVRRAV